MGQAVNRYPLIEEAQFDPRPAHVELEVQKVAVRYISLRHFCFPLPVPLHYCDIAHSFLRHDRYVLLATSSVVRHG